MEEKQRPNANYKLSNENANFKDEEIVHHYNRERRLEKAPQRVRDLCNTPPPPPQKFNLLKPLVRTKPLAMLFFTIIVICLFIVALSMLGITGTDHTLEGNHLSIQAIRFEGAIIMAVDKSTKKGNILDRFSHSAPPYTGAVDIAVQPVLKSDAEAQAGASARGEVPQDIFFHKIFFTFEPQEYYRFSIPFDTDELAVVLRTETKVLRLTVKVE